MINENVQNGRTLQSTLQDIKNELKEFVQTRIDILKNEMQQKMAAFKAALPMAVVAILLLATAWFLLTGAIVAAIALALGWPAAFAIVAGAYLIFGVVVGWLAYKEVTAQSMKPERTLQVLKQDQIWIEQEAKSA
ncbi:MAG: phage holin family protein [Terriglobales bacterium]